jgi:nucleoside-diphosphate-sugar epimerase
MTVLVTGGGGYVGAVLVPKLLDEGHHVRVLYFSSDNKFSKASRGIPACK